METETIVRNRVALTLRHSDYNGSHDTVITWGQLEQNEPGCEFTADHRSNCIRDYFHETAKMVYKDRTGCAMLITAERTADSPDLEWLEPTKKLIWLDFNV